MPTYTLRNKETGEVQDKLMSFSEREAILEEGLFEQIHTGTPVIVSGVGENISKTSGDWKDLMKSIKKGSGYRNTVVT